MVQSAIRYPLKAEASARGRESFRRADRQGSNLYSHSALNCQAQIQVQASGVKCRKQAIPQAEAPNASGSCPLRTASVEELDGNFSLRGPGHFRLLATFFAAAAFVPARCISENAAK